MIEIARRLTERKGIRGHGDWLPRLQREFGWTHRPALNYVRVYGLSLKSENFSDLRSPSADYTCPMPISRPAPPPLDEACSTRRSGWSGGAWSWANRLFRYCRWPCANRSKWQRSADH